MPKRFVRLIFLEGFKGASKRFLRRVLCAFPAQQQAPAQCKHARIIFFVEDFKCCTVGHEDFPDTRNQLRVRRRVITSLVAK